MGKHFTLRIPAILLAGLLLALGWTLPFSAQQPLFDEARIADELTRQLQLSPELTTALSDIFKRWRPRIESLSRQMQQQQVGSPQFNELRGQMERERRAMLEEFLPFLQPEQQGRLRNIINTLPPLPGGPPLPSPIQPLKQNLPTSAFSAGERLIPQPANVEPTTSRSRRASTAPSLSEEQKILHLLNRAGFGPRPGDIARVRQMGLERYLESQLHPEDLPDELLARPLLALNTLQMTSPEIAQFYLPPPPAPVRPTPTPTPQPKPAPDEEMKKPDAATASQSAETMQAETPPKAKPTPTPARPQPTPFRDQQQPLRELQQTKLLRAVFSEKQLQEVMVDFWFNHFNVFAQKDNARLLLTSYERDVIRPHALGKFKDLLVATAQSPAMLYYLDNFLSQAETSMPPRKEGDTAPPPRRPGVNENYARELMELHTLGVDGGYTQKDVQEVARCLTGWTVTQAPNWSFVFRPRTHDKDEKIVLGKRIAPGAGIEDGLRVLDLLAKHPSTAQFISRKLCQRFVADEPPQALVDRIAEVFTRTDGDIRQTVRAILTSTEFYSPKYYRNKIKSPLELAASAIRATGASTDGAQPIVQAIARMGGPLYLCQPPTGYSEDSSRWLSSATLLERMNFAVALVGNRLNGTRVDVSRFVSPEAAKSQERLLEELLAVLVHSEVSKETRDNLARVLEQQGPKATPAKYDERAAQRNREQVVSGVAALILGAREFQVK
ncbi:MAG TPA: DUF1800 domain-containing protein [Blastocatellia bacterium]|nr:DUF1800 domain-containing protein [Blastocatellia bacterium]HNG30175.1 DUF1800 domain-containing protein [Blastocatellia bacterium]